MNTIKNIVIVGGGTAGWLVAASLARQLNIINDSETNITLVESPDAPTIGVGEGTWPTMRSTLKRIGIDETDFIRECDVSFKQGTQFVNWHRLHKDGSDATYFHSFELPHTQWRTSPGPYWHYLKSELNRSYADAISVQPEACRGYFAPKTMATPAYEGLLNYAYHLDAGKFAKMLAKVATEKLGVRHISAYIERARLDEDGYITSLATREKGDIKGDFFVDCSGFAGLLIDRTYEIPFRSVKDKLFVNSAIAIQMPYERPDAPISSPTLSTAQTAGWIWDIGLQARRGTGHVYSDDFISDDEAEAQLRRYPRSRL
ncbi:Flavin-dependent tryptophan halogenase RebH [Microbulbifer aggregans]|uniref:Flavin-dependent tryptophan halogenase RebH n=1 Tax=Microbulbifer aggregans TaxID=1769779 RepID=A0A1C9W7J6_9GAMM|nr:tryptophan 7-halogenase [Microbulbifer aggregans]AOS97125.1 Flavin-dependent tryptophan halogenase RebH [Microbulbifer aggregans]